MSQELNILIVEDDNALRDALCLTLECAGHKVTGAADGPAALRLLETHAYNLVATDLKMVPMDGLQLLAEIRARHPQLPVLLMTAFGEVDKAVSAMRGGACDFLLKPFEPRVLLEYVARYANAPTPDERLIAVDPRTVNLLSLAARVALSDATVLLTGESGTGKEVFARYIHEQSARRSAPFVAINCAAIPENLLEATLFGYEKGAFTGAQSAQAGKFEQADGGTLLLDEISEMPLGLQAKLLRVLQEREVERVGGKKPIHLDIRVLATSNRDMAAEVAAGRFREDLYYRLNVFPLHIPSLRERPGDIAALARHFAKVHSERMGRAARIAAETEAVLAAQPWPGNVRELENTIQRALILAGADIIRPEHLLLMQAPRPAAPPLQAAAAPPPGVYATAPDFPRFDTAPPTMPVDATPANMKELERRHILEVLAACGGSRKRAVEQLGISERTLRYKLQQYRAEGAGE
ncbi:MAG: sigma-54 dependent transcriptional regulator [Rhodocyclaceae bacterium]|nr:sigma-54 dependent transcriptional regulator [Rhodocyclaceae bacterium]